MYYKIIFTIIAFFEIAFGFLVLTGSSYIELSSDISAKIFTLISSGIAIIIAAFGYFLKVDAEKRMSDSANIENDIKLIESFTKIMAIAHSRLSTHISEKTIELLIQNIPINNSIDLEFLKKLHPLIEEMASFNEYTGAAAQTAAIQAIFDLGHKNKILKNMAKQALHSLSIGLKNGHNAQKLAAELYENTKKKRFIYFSNY